MTPSLIEPQPSTQTPQAAARLKITHADQGRRISLAEFEQASTPEGAYIELSRGRLDLGEIPSRIHALVEAEIQRQFRYFEILSPGVIQFQGNGASAKVLIHA